MVVVDDADSGGKPQRGGMPRDHERIIRTADGTADDHIDREIKFGVSREPLELLIQHIQAFLRHLIRHDIVNTDLQMIEARAIEPGDPIHRPRHEGTNQERHAPAQGRRLAFDQHAAIGCRLAARASSSLRTASPSQYSRVRDARSISPSR